MSYVAPNPQPNLGPYPAPGNTPQPYLLGSQAMTLMAQRYPEFATVTLGDGTMLAASMALDEEAPFLGVKFSPEQDRQFPRTFRYGWPNIVSSPSPLLVSRAYPGAWYLDYEDVVPQQVLDWVCIEAWKMVSFDQYKVTTQESVQGASVRYAPASDYARGQMGQIEWRQAVLIAPFLRRDGHVVPFINWADF